MTDNKSDGANEVISIGSQANIEVVCAQCGKKGTTSEFFTYQGKDGTDVHLCPECRIKVNETLESESKNAKTGRAFFLGLVGAILGAVAWYYVTILSEMEYGIVAIGLGYLVGYAVYYGAGQRRAHKLQIISVMLTALSIFVANYYIFSHYLYQYMLANPGEFEGWDGSKIWIDPWTPDFLTTMISPIGLLIYAVAFYVAYTVCKPQKI